MTARKRNGPAILAVLALALVWTPVAQAQAVLSKAEMAFAGRWDIAHAEESPDHCELILLKEDTIGGRQVALNKACGKALAWTGEITAWRLQPDGSLVLADAQRHAVIRFQRDPAGDLQGAGPDRSNYVLYPSGRKEKRR